MIAGLFQRTETEGLDELTCKLVTEFISIMTIIEIVAQNFN